jgi:phosphohistidine phosphatase
VKTLYLARHAEAGPGRTGDLSRPLSIKGRGDARLVAAALVGLGEIPERIYTSPALRAAETADIFRYAMRLDIGDIVESSELYEAGLDELVSFVRGFDDRLTRVMVIGHNPTLSHAANYLAPRSIEGMPAGGVLGLGFDGPAWRSIGAGSVRLFETPEALQTRG